jgi:hypothetical protein
MHPVVGADDNPWRFLPCMFAGHWHFSAIPHLVPASLECKIIRTIKYGWLSWRPSKALLKGEKMSSLPQLQKAEHAGERRRSEQIEKPWVFHTITRSGTVAHKRW